MFPNFQLAYGLPAWKSICCRRCRTHPWRQPGVSETAPRLRPRFPSEDTNADRPVFKKEW